MNNLVMVPTYKLTYKHVKESPYTENTYILVLVNTVNDFDIIEMKVSREVYMEAMKGNEYTIDTKIVRTWYTLWLGKKKVYEILGNIEEGKVLVIDTNKGKLSKERIKEIKEEWRNIDKNIGEWLWEII